jgi:5,6,7,8-tetrahydromethanopterin hydro-lyase
MMMQPFDSILIGEALVGEGPEIAHIDLVIGPKGSYVEQAFVSALASPAKGHTPLLAVLEPNLPAKPFTLMVNKVTIKGAGQAILIFGPAQAAVAKAVRDPAPGAGRGADDNSILVHRVGCKRQEKGLRI